MFPTASRGVKIDFPNKLTTSATQSRGQGKQLPDWHQGMLLLDWSERSMPQLLPGSSASAQAAL